EAEYQQAVEQEIVLKSAPGTPSGGYAVHGEYVAELARQLLYNVYQDDIYSRGFNIYTTVNSADQEKAYQAVRDGILDYTRRARYPGPEENIDVPAGIESDHARFDALRDELQERHPDNGDLLTGVVLEASPEKIVVARTAQQIIEVTDKRALKIVARGLVKNANDQDRKSTRLNSSH